MEEFDRWGEGGEGSCGAEGGISGQGEDGKGGSCGDFEKSIDDGTALFASCASDKESFGHVSVSDLFFWQIRDEISTDYQQIKDNPTAQSTKDIKA